jgi:hypothetical protein
MTFVWGTIGFVFASFVPGYLAVVALRLKSYLPPFAGPFALSLIINNLLVESLVICGIYTPTMMRPLSCVLVLVALGVLLFDKRLSTNSVAAKIDGLKAWFGDLKLRPSAEVMLEILAVVSALLIFVQTLVLLKSSIGGVVLGYDPVVQWNPWAVDWSHNQFPNRIYHYPQLVPALWSIPYVVMGDSSLQFFASSFKFFFLLFAFETLAFISYRFRSCVVLLSIPFCYALLVWAVSSDAFEDYIDLPVAFFSLLSVASILKPPLGLRDQKAIVVSLLLASGAAMTKQVGLYMLGAVPLLLLCWEFEEQRQVMPVLRTAFNLAWKVGIAALLAAPIYIYAIWTIRNGTNGSEFSYLFEGVFQGQSHVGRAFAAVGRFASSGALVVLVVIAGLSVPLCWDRHLRWLLFAICIPFTLIWAFVFSYDARNLTLALPFWALTASLGIRYLLARTGQWSLLAAGKPDNALAQHGVAAALIAGAIALTALLNSHYSRSRLVVRQDYIELRELGGEPVVNGALAAMIGDLGHPHQVFSEWRFACTFSFTRGDRCVRIFPEEFFASENVDLIKHASNDTLLILESASVTPERIEILSKAGFAQAADISAKVFFIRRRRP